MAGLRLREADYLQGEAYCLHRLAVTDRPHSGFGDLTHSYGSRRENPQAHSLLKAAKDSFSEMQSQYDAMAFLQFVDRLGIHGTNIVRFYEGIPINDLAQKLSAFAVCVLAAKHARFDKAAIDDFMASDAEQRKGILRAVVQSLGSAIKQEMADGLYSALSCSSPADPRAAGSRLLISHHQP